MLKNICLAILLISCISVLPSKSFAQQCHTPVSSADHTGSNGVERAAFNCYINATELGNRYGGSGDERDFIRVKKNDEPWSNVVASVKAGDVIRVLAYMHNAGRYQAYPAKDVELNVNWSNPRSIIGKISASNTNPLIVYDTASIFVASGQKLTPVKLESFHGGAKEKYDLNQWNKQDGTLPFPVFNSSFPYARFYEFLFVISRE